MEDKKNRILIATGIYPPDIGGPATMIKALAKALRENGFIVKIITFAESRDGAPEKDVVRIRKNRGRVMKYAHYFWQMYRLARQADVVYATDTYSVGWFAYLLKKLTGQKYIIRFAGDSAWEKATANGWISDYIVDFQKKTYGKRIEELKARRRKILASADQVIAVSEFIAQVAQAIGVEKERIKIIYNSIDFIKKDIDESEVEKIREKYNQEAKIIVTACRLTPWKGVDGIIKIIPDLRKKIGIIKLLVIGEGSELENLQKLTEKLKVRDNVFFLGKIAHDQILHYFRAADLFVLNTNYEGLSHTLLEVIKTETPIVTTNIGGNPEVIEHNKSGVLVEYNNQEQLLEAAVKILSNQDLAQTYTKNALADLRKFDWEKNIKQTIEVIKKLFY